MFTMFSTRPIMMLVLFFSITHSAIHVVGAEKKRWVVPRFAEPAVTVDGFQVTEGTAVAPKWSWHGRLSTYYLSGLALANSARQIRTDLNFGVGFPGNLELSLGVQTAWTFGAERAFSANDYSGYLGLGSEGIRFGDLSLSLLWSVFNADAGGFGLLFGLTVTAPTGDNETLAGEGGFTAEPFTSLAFQIFGNRLSFNLAYRIRPEHVSYLEGQCYEQDDDLLWRIGFRSTRKFDIAWSIEAEGAIGVATYEGIWPSYPSRPVWIGAGVDFPLDRLYRLGLYTGVGIVGFSVATLSFGVQFHWMPIVPDEDNDGVRRALDRCPSLTEDIDGFEDTDGCPDLDNDQDGFPDDEDACPSTAGDDFSDDGC
jgi:hypothetical protein